MPNAPDPNRPHTANRINSKWRLSRPFRARRSSAVDGTELNDFSDISAVCIPRSLTASGGACDRRRCELGFPTFKGLQPMVTAAASQGPPQRDSAARRCRGRSGTLTPAYTAPRALRTNGDPAILHAGYGLGARPAAISHITPRAAGPVPSLPIRFDYRHCGRMSRGDAGRARPLPRRSDSPSAQDDSTAELYFPQARSGKREVATRRKPEKFVTCADRQGRLYVVECRPDVYLQSLGARRSDLSEPGRVRLSADDRGDGLEIAEGAAISRGPTLRRRPAPQKSLSSPELTFWQRTHA